MNFVHYFIITLYFCAEPHILQCCKSGKIDVSEMPATEIQRLAGVGAALKSADRRSVIYDGLWFGRSLIRNKAPDGFWRTRICTCCTYHLIESDGGQKVVNSF